MAESNTSGGPAQPAPTRTPTSIVTPTTPSASTEQKPPPRKFMGIKVPKLPSRNWLIFFAITGSLTSAIIYDRREKDRITLKWAKSISHLARQPLPSASQMPRKLTIYLEAPPGDGLRSAQDHFKEYVKPVIAQSGLDWEFVQGRQEGDIRASVAERIRRHRREEAGEAQLATDKDIIQEIRKNAHIPEYHGVLGDIVIGRHTWKEYIRGLHEGWLGPVDRPPHLVEKDKWKESKNREAKDQSSDAPVAGEADKKEEKSEEEEKKPERPKQPPPFNQPEDYGSATLPANAPTEFPPVASIAFPYLLGFSRMPWRIWRHIHRREVADDIGRQVAAACIASHREFKEGSEEGYEQKAVLASEEEDWVTSVWKEAEVKAEASGESSPERIWTKPLVMDSRIATRMRRFEIDAEAQERARNVVVKEEEIEGRIKGGVRFLWRWSANQLSTEEKKVNVGPLDED